jgi:hypothetical protein
VGPSLRSVEGALRWPRLRRGGLRSSSRDAHGRGSPEHRRGRRGHRRRGRTRASTVPMRGSLAPMRRSLANEKGPLGPTAETAATRSGRSRSPPGMSSDPAVFEGSGTRGSNSRPSAWEADALPTELVPHEQRQVTLGPRLCQPSQAADKTTARVERLATRAVLAQQKGTSEARTQGALMPCPGGPAAVRSRRTRYRLPQEAGTIAHGEASTSAALSV